MNQVVHANQSIHWDGTTGSAFTKLQSIHLTYRIGKWCLLYIWCRHCLLCMLYTLNGTEFHLRTLYSCMSKSSDKNSSYFIRSLGLFLRDLAHVGSRFACMFGALPPLQRRVCMLLLPSQRPPSRILYCFTALQKAIRQPTTATGEERGEWALKGGSLLLSTSIRWTTALAASLHFGELQFNSLDRLATPLLWQEIALG